MTVDPELNRLAERQYVLLTTFRRDGRAVPTPVWVALDAGELVVWSAPDAGKVKRIRRDGAVRIGPCDRAGRPTGPDRPATARLRPSTEVAAGMAAIARKYGIVGRLAILGSRLRRGRTGSAVIGITPSPNPD